jgi:hypothetical protein
VASQTADGDVRERNRVMRVPFETPIRQEPVVPPISNSRGAQNEFDPLPPMQIPDRPVFPSRQNVEDASEAWSPPPVDQPPVSRPPVRNPTLPNGESAPAKEKLEVSGDTITIHLAASDGRIREPQGELPTDPERAKLPDFEKVEIDGHVFVRQVDSRTGQNAFKITGEALSLIPQADNLFEAKVSGQALLESPQLNLSANRLNLDQAGNRVWVVGPGELNLTAKKSGEGDANRSEQQRITVVWKAGMIFDGEKIYFEQEVRSSTKQGNAQGGQTEMQSQSEGMSLQLTRRIDFAQLKGADKQPNDVQVSQIILVNNIPTPQRAFTRQGIENQGDVNQPVVLEKAGYDAQGKQFEKQLVVVPYVVMNVTTGDLRADGPGGLISWKLGREEDGASPFALSSTRREEGAPAEKKGIEYLHANFDKRLIGNTGNERMRIDGNVRTLYSQVQRWDQQLDPDSTRVAKGGTRITCEQIDVARWEPKGGDKPTTEVIATGNARVIGDLFEATASRLTYDERSDKLRIEGDERNAANLWSQRSGNSARNHLAAGTIIYGINDGKIEIVDMKKASLSNISSGKDR